VNFFLQAVLCSFGFRGAAINSSFATASWFQWQSDCCCKHYCLEKPASWHKGLIFALWFLGISARLTEVPWNVCNLIKARIATPFCTTTRTVYWSSCSDDSEYRKWIGVKRMMVYLYDADCDSMKSLSGRNIYYQDPNEKGTIEDQLLTTFLPCWMPSFRSYSSVLWACSLFQLLWSLL